MNINALIQTLPPRPASLKDAMDQEKILLELAKIAYGDGPQAVKLQALKLLAQHQGMLEGLNQLLNGLKGFGLVIQGSDDGTFKIVEQIKR